AQARKAIWDAINPHTQKRRIDEAFPHAMRKRTLENEMKIEFVNGSVWQVIGSDNYNSYVGSPPVGVVFSEWALADPQAWAYTMPILEENGGWALFVTTPRGHNHAETFFKAAEEAPEWFCEKLTVDDTRIFEAATLSKIKDELRRQFGVDEGIAKYNQEYLCSFDALLVGAYYMREVGALERSNRLTVVPYDSKYPVFPVFDLGHGGTTAVCYVQLVGREPRIIDYDEWRDIGIDDTARELKAKPYNYETFILPHDGADGRTTATGKSYETHFRDAGFSVRVIPRTQSVDADISLARRFFEIMLIDKDKCARLMDSLRAYHRKWNEGRRTFDNAPVHDWSSHGADAFRYAAVAFDMGLFDTMRAAKLAQLPKDYRFNYNEASPW
ncbi:MAG: hypothetical protein KGL39_45195, partial [Patescibacteria group bacterium]|nr:hypothetical protein [Patescibacteria group bacterium]